MFSAWKLFLNFEICLLSAYWKNMLGPALSSHWGCQLIRLTLWGSVILGCIDVWLVRLMIWNIALSTVASAP